MGTLHRAKAKIILLITPTQDWSELEYAIQYAVQNKLGNVISNSYGYPSFFGASTPLRGSSRCLNPPRRLG